MWVCELFDLLCGLAGPRYYSRKSTFTIWHMKTLGVVWVCLLLLREYVLLLVHYNNFGPLLHILLQWKMIYWIFEPCRETIYIPPPLHLSVSLIILNYWFIEPMTIYPLTWKLIIPRQQIANSDAWMVHAPLEAFPTRKGRKRALPITLTSLYSLERLEAWRIGVRMSTC